MPISHRSQRPPIGIIASAIVLLVCGTVWADEDQWAGGHDHDRYGPEEHEHGRDFLAFTVSFDSLDDDDGDGIHDRWGIPSWVAYQANVTPADTTDITGSFGWTTDERLLLDRIAPDDNSYHFTGSDLTAEHEYVFYQRGHLMPRNLAERLGEQATRETYTLLNAVPLAPDLNGGMWKSLEGMIEDWADMQDSIWVITGPIFVNRRPTTWLGEHQRGEMLLAIPHELLKIVIRGDPGEESETPLGNRCQRRPPRDA